MSSSSSSPSTGGGFGGGENKKPSPFDVFLKSNNKGRTSAATTNKHDGTADCDRPACEETVSALTSALNRLNEKKMKNGGSSTSSSSSSKTIGIVGVGCPPSKDYIGKSSWTLLHSMAAWYPDKPTFDEEQKMSQFMEALSIFYPCTYCADDFQRNLKISPVQTKSRKDLCSWLCEQHNIVNEKLGKPMFDCNLKNLDERWRKSSNPDCSSGNRTQ